LIAKQLSGNRRFPWGWAVDKHQNQFTSSEAGSLRRF
jgi:hypothetical protein